MKKIIGIYTLSDRNIQFEQILNLYKTKVIDTIDDVSFKDIDCLILDVINDEQSIKIINSIRAINEKLPVIWLVDFEDYKKIHSWIKLIEGIGRIETMSWFGDKCEKLTEKIELVLNPHMPVKREEIAVVIPVFNEETRFSHVKSFVRKIMSLKENNFSNIGIYFIDDGSSDHSRELIHQLIGDINSSSDTVPYKDTFKLELIKINTRKAGTYIEAFKHVNADTVVFADADDGYEVEDIVRMINLLNQGYYDIVIGTKDLIAENRPPVRRFISFCKRMLTKPLLPSGITDSQTGLKVFTGTSVNMIVAELEEKFGFAIDLKILHVAKKLKFRMIEMPVRFYDREGSHVDVIKDSISFIKSIMRITFSH